MSYSYLENEYSREEILQYLKKYEVNYIELNEKDLYENVSDLLIKGK